MLQDSQQHPSAGDRDKSISPVSAHGVSLPPSLSGRSWWDSGSAPAMKLMWGAESRVGKGLPEQRELEWDKGITTFCAFPFK